MLFPASTARHLRDAHILTTPCPTERRLMLLLQRITHPVKAAEALRLIGPVLEGTVRLRFITAPIETTRATYCPYANVVELNTSLNDVELLYLFLHECGHAFLQYHSSSIRPANWLEEKAVEALALWIAQDVFTNEELFVESTFLHDLPWTVSFYESYYKAEIATFFAPDDSVHLFEEYDFTLYQSKNKNDLFTQDPYYFDLFTTEPYERLAA
jgi:hypothetical protein